MVTATPISPLFPRLSILWWLIASLILVVLPHVSRLPWWVPLSLIALLCWRYLITRWHWQLPPPWLRFGIAFFIWPGIFLSYGTWFGRDASVALLVLLCGIKFLEMRNLRDAFLICFLSYFLIITNFLYSQSIPTALYMGMVMLVTTATLISLSDNNECLLTRQRLRLAATLLLQALPLMLVLFVLFPRITGPFWSLPKDIHKGITGLTDSLSLGHVSELSLSDEVAFRVRFAGEVPPPTQRYWRGPILWRTNGQDWKSGFLQQYFLVDDPDIQPAGEPFDYTVTLEPHHERWLFALDLPSKAPPEGKMTPDYQIVTRFPIHQRMRYEVRSYTNYRAQIFLPQQHHQALRLPKGKHPRARALAAQWQQENPQPEAIVQRALQYFNQEPFIYSYTPELLPGDPVDVFLFETRQGFCEHYAVAFTVLMRAAQIPARIVTGYLGGTFNPIGGYFIVRQRDAHAWSEVWLADRGWVRIDPTGAVAPERIERGIDLVLPTDDALGIDWDSDSDVVKIWQQLRNSWDMINNSWNQWVLSYDSARQKQLLNHLGLKGINWLGMTIALVVLMVIFLSIVAIWIWLRSRVVERDSVQQVYLRFCQKLARQGFHRSPSEGPLTFADRVSRARPDLATAVEQIVKLYIQTRYRSQFEILPQLRRAVRLFHP